MREIVKICTSKRKNSRIFIFNYTRGAGSDETDWKRNHGFTKPSSLQAGIDWRWVLTFMNQEVNWLLVKINQIKWNIDLLQISAFGKRTTMMMMNIFSFVQALSLETNCHHKMWTRVNCDILPHDIFMRCDRWMKDIVLNLTKILSSTKGAACQSFFTRRIYNVTSSLINFLNHQNSIEPRQCCQTLFIASFATVFSFTRSFLVTSKVTWEENYKFLMMFSWLSVG